MVVDEGTLPSSFMVFTDMGVGPTELSEITVGDGTLPQ